ncbi:MAG TPA: mycofactocin biosynthesis chaperone MftB, partial [Nocardioides sp.]
PGFVEFLDEPWALSPSVALRPEPFGAMAYHFGNRKLTFLKRPELVAAVRSLSEQPDVRSALISVGIPTAQHTAYAEALRGLAATDMIRPRTQEQP